METHYSMKDLADILMIDIKEQDPFKTLVRIQELLKNISAHIEFTNEKGLLSWKPKTSINKQEVTLLNHLCKCINNEFNEFNWLPLLDIYISSNILEQKKEDIRDRLNLDQDTFTEFLEVSESMIMHAFSAYSI